MIERRYYDSSIELRKDGEESPEIIRGLGAVVERESELLYDREHGHFVEVIDRDAFKNADLSDVVALFNHDENIIFARTTSGTLTLSIDDRGLSYNFNPPNSPNGDNLRESVRRGDISKSSFAFYVNRDTEIWKDEVLEDKSVKTTRRIMDITKVVDVSPVTHAAYSDTDVNQNSIDLFYEHRKANPINQEDEQQKKEKTNRSNDIKNRRTIELKEKELELERAQKKRAY